ncbi:MAG: hypothetical protein OEV00_04840 [Acidobacteriota bacterium]|nr:hypothetical protein [Acidobacteriota bacterium]
MRRKRGALTVVLLIVLAMAGCAGDAVNDASPPEEPGLAEHAAAIALEIEADPDSTEQILERYGLSAEEFENMLLEISEDEAMREAYTALVGD